jgi:hypothetical protein
VRPQRFGTLKPGKALCKSLLLAVGLLLASERVGRAQQAACWTLEISPSLWGVNLRGTMQGGPGTAPITANFSDGLNSLEVGILLETEARHGRWGILLDPFYADFDRAVPSPSGPYVQIDSMQFQVGLAGAYRVSESPAATFDVYLGGRYNQLNMVLKQQGLPSSKTIQMWVDPIIGAQAAIGPSDRWGWRVRADVGGFSVGSRLAWSAKACLTYQLTTSTALAFGYGVISTDYETTEGNSQLRYNVRIGGPFVGATFRF